MMATRINAPWTGVVLAGGRSSRMGTDKARLLWHGTPLLLHMQNLLAEAGASQVIVSGDYPGVCSIPDVVIELGPLGGLASVTDVLSDGLLIVVPVDMPLITPTALASLAASHGRCVCYRDHMLPMRLQLDAHLRSWLKQALSLAPRDRSLHALHTAMSGRFLPLPDDSDNQLGNFNTPEEWREANP